LSIFGAAEKLPVVRPIPPHRTGLAGGNFSDSREDRSDITSG
jgi:hypothetical protein